MTRLDAALVAGGLARSRGHARDLIDQRVVTVGGVTATKAALQVGPDDQISLDLDSGDGTHAPVLDARWVSRAAGKLIGALEDLSAGGPVIAGRSAVDVGACTGGFTQVLLDRGAAHVYAVDVGHDQLAATLRDDPRVTDVSGLNARELTPDHLAGPVDLAVADLSFISLTLILPRLASVLRDDGDLLVLIKPQFEVGRAGLDGRGVVRSDRLRAAALRTVLALALDIGLEVRDLVRSRLTGQDGNHEYVAWLVRGPHPGTSDTVAARRAWESVSTQITSIIAADAAPGPRRGSRGGSRL